MSFGGLKSQESNNDLAFTGRFIVFAELDVPAEEVEEFRQYCRTKGLKLVWRDSKYAEERSRFERPMAFISHDSRDKKEVAEPIASGLQALHSPVWYDEYSLGVGDSLRESIEKGIKEAHKCILVLSPNFFANNGWTKAEFDSIYMREIIEQQNVMLPIWHNVSKQDVYNSSPRLADRVGLNTSIGITEVVRRLYAKLSPSKRVVFYTVLPRSHRGSLAKIDRYIVAVRRRLGGGRLSGGSRRRVAAFVAAPPGVGVIQRPLRCLCAARDELCKVACCLRPLGARLLQACQ